MRQRRGSSILRILTPLILLAATLPVAAFKSCEAGSCDRPCPHHLKIKEPPKCCTSDAPVATVDSNCECPKQPLTAEAPAVFDLVGKTWPVAAAILPHAIPHAPLGHVSERIAPTPCNHGPPLAGFGRPDASRAPPRSA